jgi:hypothetical protein
VIYRIVEGERFVQIITIDTGLTSIVGLAEANGAAYDGQSGSRYGNRGPPLASGGCEVGPRRQN